MRKRIAPLIKLVQSGSGFVTTRKVRRALYGGAAYYRAPGKGIPASQIVGAYRDMDFVWGPSGMGWDDSSNYVLFKDGQVWRDPKVFPADADIARAKQAVPQDWGHWQRVAGDIIITLDGHRYKASQFIHYDPAPTGPRRGSVGQCPLHEFNGHQPNGQYCVESRHYAASQRALRIRWRQLRSFSGAGAADAIGESQPSTTGTYRISGYCITLEYDDGRTLRALFYWAGNTEDPFDIMTLGNAKYVGGLE